jgi:hypothetical protein
VEDVAERVDVRDGQVHEPIGPNAPCNDLLERSVDFPGRVLQGVYVTLCIWPDVLVTATMTASRQPPETLSIVLGRAE